MLRDHQRFSRWMPPIAEPEPGFTGWLALVVLGGTVLAFVLAAPLGTLSFLGTVATVTIALERKRSQRVSEMVTARAGEDIGSFARAFDRKTGGDLDPWAIRAVWNALVPLTDSKGDRIPLRPTDHIVDDLEIDPGDLEDLVPQLVEQCERLPSDWAANPYYYRPNTVGALVHFISAQPLRRSA